MSRRIDTLVVHCADTYADQDIGVVDIDEWHTARGWNGCGYHKVIRRNGVLETGRDDEQIGAHAYGFNQSSLAVCLAGGKSKLDKPANNFTDAQFKTLYALLERWQRDYPQAKVLGHRDLPQVHKDCPCFDVRPWYESAKRDAMNSTRDAPGEIDDLSYGKSPEPAVNKAIASVEYWVPTGGLHHFCYLRALDGHYYIGTASRLVVSSEAARKAAYAHALHQLIAANCGLSQP